ncbi:MAG: branched-chain amino acid ABC transporter permease [Elusimicrobiales bacterium]|nr:branched-chain amino acid ABC transporter permease [Elusimicrobiales bacterium]
MLLQFIINGVAYGSIIGMCAIGLALIYNTTKIFHFAHAGIFTISVYTFYFLISKLQISLILSFFISSLFSSFIALLIDKLFYIPILNRKATSTAYTITSLAIYITIVNIISIFFGNETKILKQGIDKTYEIGSAIITKTQLLEIITYLLFFLFLFLFLSYTKTGRLLRAVSSNYKLSKALGVDIKKIRTIAFFLGSFLAAIAANLNGLDIGTDPHSGMPIFLNSAVAMIVGGIGQFIPAAISGIIIGIIQSLVVYKFSAKWQMATTFVILLIILLFRPQGIFSSQKRIEEKI